MDSSRSIAARSIAASYLRRGWRVVPVPHQSKAPVIDGWQTLRIGEARLDQYFGRARMNVGVLLGQPSRWLIDIDLDHKLAVELAASLLPSTGAIFGRASKRRSHWLYYAASPVATRQWRLADKKMVVELRSTGGQTIFPSSIHPSGEQIQWDTDGELAVVDPLELEATLQQLYQDVCKRLNISRPPVPGRPTTSCPTAPSRVVERARCYLAKLPPAISGQGGHDATFHAACCLVLGFGLEREQALALLTDWNHSCQPPWSDRELEHKVDDALKQTGWRGYLLMGQPRSGQKHASTAIERANRHAIEHRRKLQRRAHA